jgi:hypothetical protein
MNAAERAAAQAAREIQRSLDRVESQLLRSQGWTDRKIAAMRKVRARENALIASSLDKHETMISSPRSGPKRGKQK